MKNVTDFNVADSVRRDIKVLVTKTSYTVSLFATDFNIQIFLHHTYSMNIL